MERAHWTHWTPRMGRWADTRAHRWIKLQFVGGDVGYIHHGDDRVTGNDVLYHDHRYHGHHTACVHVGDYCRRVLVVSEHYRKRDFDYIDKRNGNLQWPI
jgi:hypothetical protein